MPANRRRAIGLMSGTSIDAIDVALVETDGEEIAALGPAISIPYAAALRASLRAALGRLEGCEELGRALTAAHAAAVASFLEANGIARDAVDVVGFHGHTLAHRPDLGRTRQLGDPAWLAHALGIDVVGDFRQADVAAGGQGAPLAPIYHARLLDHLAGGGQALAWPVAVLNVGGVANLTYVDEGARAQPERLLAFDTGPGNALIDDWVLAATGEAFDRDGRLAAAGSADGAAVKALLDHPYFARRPPKSLDRDAFAAPAPSSETSPADRAATLTAFTVESVVRAREHLPLPPGCWLVTGGGRRNRHLVGSLARRLAAPVRAIEAVGGRGDSLEAEAFAFMAVRALRGLPISFPGTTGVPAPMAGGVVYRPG